MKSLPPKKNPWPLLSPLLIVFLVIAVYANTLSVPFAFDDESYIVNNPVIKDLRYFSEPARIEEAIANKQLDVNFHTRTVAFFSFALNYAVHRLDLPGYHLVNILIHLGNGLLVYGLLLLTLRTPFFAGCRRPGRLAPLFAALFFVSHPLQTQAVTYLTQRFASLATFFCLASLLLYVGARLGAEVGVRPWRRRCAYVFSLLALALAMKTKELAFTFPLLIGLYEFLFLAGERRKRVLSLIPPLLTMAIIPLSILGSRTRYADIDRLAGAGLNPGPGNAALTYLYTQFRVILTYLRLLLWPVNQNVDYDYPPAAGFFTPGVFFSFLILLALAALGVGLYRRSLREGEMSPWLRLAAYGIAWFFTALAVESTIVPLNDMIFEHRLYLPSVGIFMALTATCEWARIRLGRVWSWRLVAAMTLLVGAWSFVAQARNEVWGDAVGFWRDTAAKSPGKARVHLNLGRAYRDQGRLPEAIRSLEEALRLQPGYGEVYRNLGQIYYQQGDYDRALRFSRQALQGDAGDAELHSNLGAVYEKLNRLKEAEEAYRQALGLRGNLATVHSNLSVIYLRQNRLKEALAESSQAVGSDPENYVYHVNHANAQAMNGLAAEAVRSYRRALELNPLDVAARQLLEYTLKNMKK